MVNTNKNKKVLVTGGSGFVGAYCILALLNEGYTVKTTVRTLNRKETVIEMLQNGGITNFDALSFVEADLTKDANWDEAANGCEYILHVASPFPSAKPKDEDEVIKPAVDGTLRVLKAAKNTGVKRVVLTSSFAAVGYGQKPTAIPFTEESWTDTTAKGLSAYVKSKTLAEKAAWDFIKTEGRGLELTVINPAGIFGPVLGNDYSSSIQLIQQLMDGSMKSGVPRISFGIVDVRDLAELHLKAMISPVANGERFLAVAGDALSLEEVALIIKTNLKDAPLVPTRAIPNFILRVLGLFNSKIAEVVPNLGIVRNASADKARKLLHWAPRSPKETILATARSLIKFEVAQK